ncbi:3'(2'),5'-bisphosphate nucleotidase CysQ [Sulfobacillus thermosulfidooxidans]|uniref:3'(2'),5'-bisphosphate nucleotidase CysQ n=1 Tax=Sulfobacillus thermosulfidooxidans TaxID=28034 RepID=UPI0009FA35B8|nr:3'(2'),5'-bisphosphate nucleotidase CysQ [Sulfobacillus thermosulfidooxidans]
MMTEWKVLAQGALDAVKAARAEILTIMKRVYEVQYKNDHSPVTEADMASQAILIEKLHQVDPSIPVVSEELQTIDYETRLTWPRLWMVDPLDGTKEFVRGNGEFTINVALIENHQAVIGVIDWPVGDITYMAIKNEGAYRLEKTGSIRLHSHSFSNPANVVISRSHRQSEIDWVRRSQIAIRSIDYVGSALKFCRIAEGRDDVYPRLTPNMEWDSAAGHILVAEAGGQVVDFLGHPLQYNKPDLHNEGFVAVGDWAAWREYFVRQGTFSK